MIIWPSFYLVSRCQKKRKPVSTCFPDAIDSSEKSQEGAAMLMILVIIMMTFYIDTSQPTSPRCRQQPELSNDHAPSFY